ncbi:MAG: amidohydrolase [Desulfarculales bacterium]|jgi:5-methylthioadenosine/S-adenosylhomocysteine deaminase|nr:amidohydrolase [Desulfarculales bacterium]
MAANYIYVRGGSVLLPQGQTLEEGEVHCRGDEIIYCGPREQAPPPPRGAKCLDGSNGLTMPGLINTHTHAAMTLMRGVADDQTLHVWLNEHIFPLEANLTAQTVYWGSLLACLEMIKSGITCFADMYYFPHQTMRAARRAGLRALLGETLTDSLARDGRRRQALFRRAREFALACRDSRDIRPVLNMHAVYTCSPPLLREGKELAEELDLGLHMHLCETREEVENCRQTWGRRPVAHLRELGVLGPRLWAAHGIWLNEEEMDILAGHGVGISHCPTSNMKLASGRADIPALLTKGVGVGLGTDGSASNNRLDMFREMDLCAKIHKLAALDPAVMPAGLVIELATSRAARLIGWPELGNLRPGAPADFIVVDFDAPHMTPLNNHISHLVYSAQSSDVRHSVCQGKVLMENRWVGHLDSEEIKAKAGEQINFLRRRL